LHWRVSHATSHSDILDAVQHVRDDAATDWIAQILLQQDISIACVEREKVSFGVAGEKQTASSRSNGREHGRIGVVLPQHVAAVGVDGSDMAEPLRVMVAKVMHWGGLCLRASGGASLTVDPQSIAGTKRVFSGGEYDGP
jgi:hypothetical protein